MDALRLVIPAAALLALFGGLFGVVLARVIWADEANHASKLKADYVHIQEKYNEIHEKDQRTIVTMQSTIDALQKSR